MCTPFVVTELAGHPIIFVEAREARLVVLVLEFLPAKKLRKFFLSILFNIGNQVERFDNLHSQNFLVINFIRQYVHNWEFF